jgi:hypothetical protein
MTLPFLGFSQHEEFKMKIEAFSQDMEADYKISTLNISPRDIGMIFDTYPSYTHEFVLKAKEKKENNLGRSSKYSYYLAFFSYDDNSDLNYAMKDWLKEFFEDNSVRPGRETKRYPYAKPSIVIVNETNISLITFECSQYDVQMYREWRSQMLSYFGDDNSVVIELLCEGPLQWTKNPPDPKDRTWR